MNLTIKPNDFFKRKTTLCEMMDFPEELKYKDINIFWSGGLDSTFMMIWLAAKGYMVHTHWVELTCNKNKNELETEAREKIMKTLAEEYPSIRRRIRYNKESSVMIKHNGMIRSALGQATTWIYAMQLIDHDVDDFAIGYVAGDDAVAMIDDINYLIKANDRMAKNGKNARVHFPLAKMKKIWFYGEMPESICKDLHWCELGGNPSTCSCPACKTHRHMLDSLGEVKLIEG